MRAMTNTRRPVALILALISTSALAVGAQAVAVAPSSADCGPNDRPEPALQGQVPMSERLNGSAAEGYRCNLELVGHLPGIAYATFEAYGDCVYYADQPSAMIDAGVVVLDVSDPSSPVQTDYLTARAMRGPGESLRLNHERGLLVADHYNANIAPVPGPSYAADGTPQDGAIHRTLAVYDVSQDCSHPELLADVEIPGANGHEGCFQPDGMVYYISGYSITPVDLSDPRTPVALSEPWELMDPRPLGAHGCSISADGNRGYFSDSYNNRMVILDTSQVQARQSGAQATIISSFDTPDELQQSSIPITYDGQRHVVLWTEAKYPFKTCVPGQENFGYPRILDVSDEENPVEISSMQAEVVRPQNCSQVAADASVQPRGLERGDPFNPAVASVGGFLYDSHYCRTDRLADPTALACGQAGSGVRVYDIRDPHAPVEIAYYNTGTTGSDVPTLDWAAAPPVFRADLGQLWWVTVEEGFHAARFRDGMWPFPVQEE